ncbi:hypothetical protein GCM10011506_29770 [Marivirga lumbricoides]|uniref:RHS repeat-associated core domain-containing protein n=1 Tax=Marivirga lumbricoides TaxID=1046115 RepID=A0ABQ1MKT0_9BACT|nr:hypothetical protein GCM10011506_29770 [Marivirga lumbricoides]
MGCLKLSYYEAGEGIGETAFFSGGSLEKKEGALKNCYNYYPFGLTFNSYKREYSKENTMNTFQDQEVIKDFDLNWVQFKWRNDMPELGRFFNVDPLAEDYYYNSPYAFSENRVIDGIELEGLEWKSIKDDDNKTVINIVNVKVQNNSKLDNTSAMALVMDVMNESEKSYSGVDSDGYKVITKATIDFDSPVSEGDFYIELRDNIEMSGNSISNYAYGKVDKIGDTKSNRIQLNARKAENDREGLIKSGVHELGHTGGLTHPNPNSSAPGKDDNGNYLDSKNVMLHNSDNKSVTPQQLKLINDTIENLQNGF